MKKYTIAYYHEGEYFPVADFVTNKLNPEQRGKVKKYADLLEELGPELRSPYVEKLKGYTDLWELRPSFWKVEIRIIFTWFKNAPVFLEGLIEKSEGKKTKRHYDRANSRKNSLFNTKRQG